MNTTTLQEHAALGRMPSARRMVTVDEAWVGVAPKVMFELARNVEQWPQLLPHYRYVRFRERRADGGGLVEMSANRPFGAMRWPTWWLSLMNVDASAPAIRFRHIEGITTGMDVEWQFTAEHGGTRVRIVHAWDGPHWPLIGPIAATRVIGPVFVHGIASRTLAGLAAVAERTTATKELVE
jgi:ribosome-associated toxin RatA of RatAB toxin-antitoxin module